MFKKKAKASWPRPTSSLLRSRSWNELGTSAVCPRGLLGVCGMCSFRTSCAQVVSQNVAHTFFLACSQQLFLVAPGPWPQQGRVRTRSPIQNQECPKGSFGCSIQLFPFSAGNRSVHLGRFANEAGRQELELMASWFSLSQKFAKPLTDFFLHIWCCLQKTSLKCLIVVIHIYFPCGVGQV